MIGSKNNRKLYKNLIEKSIPTQINLYVEPFGGEFGLYQIINKPKLAIYNDINKKSFNKVSDKYVNDDSVRCFNFDYKKIIEKYDDIDTFFYVDPPYFLTYYYEYNFDTNEQHIELANILKNIKGKFLLSYQDRDFITNLYQGFKIDKFSGLDIHLKPEITIKNY